MVIFRVGNWGHVGNVNCETWRFHGHLMGLNGWFMGCHWISWGNVIFHGILGYAAPITMVNYIHLQKIELHFQVGIYKSKDKEC